MQAPSPSSSSLPNLPRSRKKKEGGGIASSRWSLNGCRSLGRAVKRTCRRANRLVIGRPRQDHLAEEGKQTMTISDSDQNWRGRTFVEVLGKFRDKATDNGWDKSTEEEVGGRYLVELGRETIKYSSVMSVVQPLPSPLHGLLHWVQNKNRVSSPRRGRGYHTVNTVMERSLEARVFICKPNSRRQRMTMVTLTCGWCRGLAG